MAADTGGGESSEIVVDSVEGASQGGAFSSFLVRGRGGVACGVAVCLCLPKITPNMHPAAPGVRQRVRVPVALLAAQAHRERRVRRSLVGAFGAARAAGPRGWSPIQLRTHWSHAARFCMCAAVH